MNMHESDITSRFSRFLDRKAPPRRFEGKSMAQDDEMRALIAAITRHAPRSSDALAAWWPVFESALSEACGDFWPAEKLIKPAAQKASQEVPRKAVAELDIDTREIAIAARKMQRGDPVGEGYLWGRMAVEMIGEKLIDHAKMDSYRKVAFFSRVGKDGDKTAALAWEAEAKARHEAAKLVWRHRGDEPQQRDTTAPDLRVGFGVAAE